MIALFLLLLIAAIALGIVGVVAKGLLYWPPCGCGDDQPDARPDDLFLSGRHACQARMADRSTELA
jgi:hypothetical protein